jgi:hypothetical protein
VVLKIWAWVDQWVILQAVSLELTKEWEVRQQRQEFNMRLDEFYNPEEDTVTGRKSNENRKARLTLKQVNKLRKMREAKRLEEFEHTKLVKRMYGAPANPAGGSGLGF